MIWVTFRWSAAANTFSTSSFSLPSITTTMLIASALSSAYKQLQNCYGIWCWAGRLYDIWCWAGRLYMYDLLCHLYSIFNVFRVQRWNTDIVLSQKHMWWWLVHRYIFVQNKDQNINFLRFSKNVNFLKLIYKNYTF